MAEVGWWRATRCWRLQGLGAGSVWEGGKEKLGVDFCLTPLLFLLIMGVGPWLVWAWVIFWMGGGSGRGRYKEYGLGCFCFGGILVLGPFGL